jgi:hypothetical protein
MILSDDENNLLNGYNFILEGTYPDGNEWYGRILTTGIHSKKLFCLICKNLKLPGKIYYTKFNLEIHGKSHLKEVNRILSLKEFL